MIAFGPVPSRRLGRSLGINHLPPKHCSYSCTYCQVGRTPRQEMERGTFLSPREVVDAVTRKVEACAAGSEKIDYLTFVPDGEPTLDENLGLQIRALRPLGIPIAVITNGSLLADPAVRTDLRAADLVSVKVDAVRPEIWNRINRPHPDLELEVVLRGVSELARGFGGTLLTETMLVAGVNDDAESVTSTADFLARVGPARAYLAVPTRPPAEGSVAPPDEEIVVRAYELLRDRLPSVELLVGGEEGSFGRTGDPQEDLLAILAVHPMREEAVERYLGEVEARRSDLDRLVESGRVARLEYLSEVFYVRSWQRRSPARSSHEEEPCRSRP
jgi:wyosine [tRNA(Phe)-imidazoG37] synthetase (radical SAM superfamily)